MSSKIIRKIRTNKSQYSRREKWWRLENREKKEINKTKTVWKEKQNKHLVKEEERKIQIK